MVRCKLCPVISNDITCGDGELCTEAVKSHICDRVTVIESSCCDIFYFNSLPPGSLILTFDSGIAALEYDLQIFFRLYLLLLNRAHLEN